MSDPGDPERTDDASRYGNVGQHDPHADPVTQPALVPAHVPVGGAQGDEHTVDLRVDTPPDEQPTTKLPAPKRSGGSLFGGLYIGLVLAALVLILLLVFILQNDVPVEINFLWMTGRLPSGVALLLAAIAGVLLVAIPGSGRIMQLRRAARRAEKGR